jgi:methylase of polypeptide subunit release factors
MTPPSTDAPPFDLSRLTDVAWLKDRFDASGMTPQGVASLAPMLMRGGLADGLRRLDADQVEGLTGEPARTLARLFIIGTPVTRDAALKVLGQAGLAQLLDAGVLRASGDDVSSCVCLTPTQGVLAASDHYVSDAHPDAGPSHVLGVGNASVATADLTVRKPGRLALDIGAGQGFLAVLASRHCASVIGTEINPRAIAMATLTARLNGVSNIDLREGSFLDPVKGMEGRFDLIVSNPPFIITPRGGLTAITSGLTGDGAAEHLLREAPAFLREGGWMTMLLSWHHPLKGDWSQRPRDWIAKAGCDAWLMRFSTSEPGAYFRELAATPGEGATLDFKAWQEFCAANNVGAVSYGAMILRKVPGEGWVRVDTQPHQARRGPAGPLIERIFDTQRVLMSVQDTTRFMSLRLRAVEGTKIITPPPGSGAPPGQVQLQHPQGLLMPMMIGREVADSLGAFDGSRPVRAIVKGPSGAAAAHEFEKRVRTLLSEMLARGYFTVVTGD